MTDIGLPQDVISAIKNVLGSSGKISKAVIFGSRAKGNSRPYSDIDIALYGDITSTDAEHIAQELDALPTAYTFDITAASAIKNPALREHIARVGVIIFDAVSG